MLVGARKEQKLRDGEELKAALCTACGSQAPQRFDNVLLNVLLDFAQLPRDHPKKDPLELKHTLAAIDPALGKLSLKQRKALESALELQRAQCTKHGLPVYFHVEGGWPPKEPELEPPRAGPKPGSELVVSATPLSGEGDGFTWTQTEAELIVTVHVPDGTQKQEIMMQLTPKFGPAQQIALRARFWPLPLISGVLQHPIDASEAVWHLDTNCKVTIDLPKIDEKLWAGTPAVFTSGPGPLAEYRMPELLDSADEVGGAAATGGGGAAAADSPHALVAGIAPECVVQKMGQRPNDLEAQLHGCHLLSQLIGADPGKSLSAANARAIPVVLRLLRYFGHKPDVQLAAWHTLVTLVEAQPFLRKVLSDEQGMKLTLAGMDAHKASEAVLAQLSIACRLLLPATPPRLFVEAGGLEVLVESIRQHPASIQLGEVAGSCLHMLAGVNNIVRRMILRMDVLPTLLSLCDSHETRASVHEVTLGLASQLVKGDVACQQLFCMQLTTTRVLQLLRRFPSVGPVVADGARALAGMLTSEAAVLTLVADGGLIALKAALADHSGGEVENEVINVLEQAICAMSEAVGEEAPDDELDADEMLTLLERMASEARERERKAAEAKRRDEEEARAAAEAAEAARRATDEEEAARVAKVEAEPVSYSGFSWGSSFDDPRLAAGVEDAPDAPRIVELDDD